MIDKKKQIEEMAKIICKDGANDGDCDKCGFHRQCSKFKVAEKLYNAGYRKIPEGVVVIPKEISYYENIKKALRTVRLGEKSVGFTNEQIMALTQIFHWEELREKEQIRKETAEKFAPLRKYITEQFHRYHEVRGEAESEYKKCKDKYGKEILNNDWHRADAIMFILEKVGIEFDEIVKEITEGE